MRTLTNMELEQIKGGFKFGVFFSAASIVTFLIGIIDGYTPTSYTY